MLVSTGLLEQNIKMITKQQLYKSLKDLISLLVKVIVWILATIVVLILTTGFLFQSFYLIVLSKRGMLKMTLLPILRELRLNLTGAYQKTFIRLKLKYKDIRFMESKYYTDVKIREAIDRKLMEMASLFANTGQDSTLRDIKDAYRKEWKLMDEIQELDQEFGKMIRPYSDKEWTTITKS